LQGLGPLLAIPCLRPWTTPTYLKTSPTYILSLLSLPCHFTVKLWQLLHIFFSRCTSSQWLRDDFEQGYQKLSSNFKPDSRERMITFLATSVPDRSSLVSGSVRISCLLWICHHINMIKNIRLFYLLFIKNRIISSIFFLIIHYVIQHQ
jgi:hypothetical protein